MFKHILVATDGSPLADKAVATALTLSRNCGAKVTALMVVQDYTTAQYASEVIKLGLAADELREQLASQGRERLDAVLERHDLANVAIERQVAVADDAYEQILRHAAKGACDLIVMASHGRGPVKAALLGSQTLHVLKYTQVPVIVVR